MRPDGEGTDSYNTPETRRRKPKSTNSIERDVLKLALAFVVVALICCGAIWLNKRQFLPSQSDSDPTAQQTP